MPDEKDPVLTTLDEFYKIGPGPSSSHTMGPMRITFDFNRRASALPSEVLARATAIEVELFGSLSATGRGHGTDRAALAGLLGQAPASCPPSFLDDLAADPSRVRFVLLGPARLPVSLASIVFADPREPVPHPNTMRVRLLAGREPLFEVEYYSVGGGFIEWKGYRPPAKGRPRFPYHSMKELRAHAREADCTLARILLENEEAITGRTEAEILGFLDQVIDVMIGTVEHGLSRDGLLPGPLKLHAKARLLYQNAQTDVIPMQRAIAELSACAVAAAEENARGHVVVTAPTAGSAGVLPALVSTLVRSGPFTRDSLRTGMLTAAAVGYLCKHNATLSGAEGGCQAEIGVASAMGAALCADVLGGSPGVIEHAAESALEHHLGMTCDPVGGYVLVPCIERCAFGAVKAWTAFCIARDVAEERHRIDLDTAIAAMAMTARDMSTKYKETSQAGLAALVIC